MTTEACQKFCSDGNYGLAATEGGDTCYCGNGLQSYSALGQRGCGAACSGNSSEICGGSKYLSVWNSTSTRIPPTTVKQVGVYVHKGCYSDDVSLNGTHALGGSKYSSADALTVEACVGYCITKGYDVAGVEYGGVCYCDSKLSSAAKQLSDGQCNMPCTGNGREFCGAYSALNIYQKDSSSVGQDGTPASINKDNTATIQANTTRPALD